MLKDAVQTAKERMKRKQKDAFIPGFCLENGLDPILPIYTQGYLKVHLLKNNLN